MSECWRQHLIIYREIKHSLPVLPVNVRIALEPPRRGCGRERTGGEVVVAGTVTAGEQVNVVSARSGRNHVEKVGRRGAGATCNTSETKDKGCNLLH